jgi:hypothetical protein
MSQLSYTNWNFHFSLSVLKQVNIINHNVSLTTSAVLIPNRKRHNYYHNTELLFDMQPLSMISSLTVTSQQTRNVSVTLK